MCNAKYKKNEPKKNYNDYRNKVSIECVSVSQFKLEQKKNKNDGNNK